MCLIWIGYIFQCKDITVLIVHQGLYCQFLAQDNANKCIGVRENSEEKNLFKQGKVVFNCPNISGQKSQWDNFSVFQTTDSWFWNS